jgi:hypothetical protein
MEDQIKEVLRETEAQHEKTVVLYAQINEQINKFKSESEKITHALTVSKGQIEAYRKSLEIISQNKE